MTRATWTWFAAVGFALALSACDDEIVDVDLPKADAAADRAADSPREATSDGGGTGDGGGTSDGGGPSDDAKTTDALDTDTSDAALAE